MCNYPWCKHQNRRLGKLPEKREKDQNSLYKYFEGEPSKKKSKVKTLVKKAKRNRKHAKYWVKDSNQMSLDKFFCKAEDNDADDESDCDSVGSDLSEESHFSVGSELHLHLAAKPPMILFPDLPAAPNFDDDEDLYGLEKLNSSLKSVWVISSDSENSTHLSETQVDSDSLQEFSDVEVTYQSPGIIRFPALPNPDDYPGDMLDVEVLGQPLDSYTLPSYEEALASTPIHSIHPLMDPPTYDEVINQALDDGSLWGDEIDPWDPRTSTPNTSMGLGHNNTTNLGLNTSSGNVAGTQTSHNNSLGHSNANLGRDQSNDENRCRVQ